VVGVMRSLLLSATVGQPNDMLRQVPDKGQLSRQSVLLAGAEHTYNHPEPRRV